LEKLLEISDLTVEYVTNNGTFTAVDSVNLGIDRNQLLAVIGESGCGKSTLGLSIIGLLPPNSKVSGEVGYKGENLLTLKQKQMRNYRGTEVAMIFQEPLTSLNPVYRVGDQIASAIQLRRSRKDGRGNTEDDGMQKVYRRDLVPFPRMLKPSRKIPSEDKREAAKWLEMVRIADPEQVMERYPFELSGGMAQRVMIAIALSQKPALLIADEPTTALDVTTQAQVLKLMRDLMTQVNTSILLISHDLAVASQVADRIVVMYAGEIAEDAEVHALFSDPMHPYTKGLLACIPHGTKDDSHLDTIAGSIPDLGRLPKGCRFNPRCPYAFEPCRSNIPRLIRVNENHEVSCYLYAK
jgi:oligopeptide/dipeptide ABC transporter ATP-binding protein